MRDWKNWLFPLLTCLIVLVLALLPRRLSLLEDGTLTGVVHSEDLSADSNFPARAPELPGRIWLLARYSALPEGLTIVHQELEGAALEEASDLARTELRHLAEADILPEEIEEIVKLSGEFTGNRIYLRDQADLSSAAFLELSSYNQETDALFWLYLDWESGQLLALESTAPLFTHYLMDAESIGRSFLDRMGVEYERLSSEKAFSKGDGESIFRLPDSFVCYTVRKFWDRLDIFLDVDWEHLDSIALEEKIMDSGIRSALGYSPYDG